MSFDLDAFVGTSLYVLNLILTFSVFCGVVVRLLITQHPMRTVSGFTQWSLWGAVHIGIAIGMLGIFFHNLGHVHVSHWYVLILRLSLAGYFLLEWRTSPATPTFHGA